MSSTNDTPFSINDEKQVNQNPLEETKKAETDSAKAVAKIEAANVVVHQAIDFINEGIMLSPFDPDIWQKAEEIYAIVTNAVSKVKATKDAVGDAAWESTRSFSGALYDLFISNTEWQKAYLLNCKAIAAWTKLGDAIGEMHLAIARSLIAKHLTRDENAAILCAEKALQAIDTAMEIVPEATHAWEAFYHMIPAEDNPGSTGTQIRQETPQRFYSAVI
jgi:hypothetical protein